MFKLNEKSEVSRSILKCDYIRYSPSEISTTNTANSHIYIYIYIYIYISIYLEEILLFLC